MKERQMEDTPKEQPKQIPFEGADFEEKGKGSSVWKTHKITHPLLNPIKDDDDTEPTPAVTEEDIKSQRESKEESISRPPVKTGDRFKDKEAYDDWLADRNAKANH